MRATGRGVVAAVVMGVTLAMFGSIGRASALTSLYATSASTSRDIVWVGMIDAKGDGVLTRVAVACFEDTVGSNDRIVLLWTYGSYGLKDDYNIHGDPAGGGTGGDAMYLVAAGYTPTGYCAASNTAIFESGTSWTALNYNGHYLDLYGDGGNETLVYDGGGSNNTYLSGGDGDDVVWQASSIGAARGDGGADIVWGLTGGNGDQLTGGAGDYDCLWDDNNSFTTYDCGGQANDAHDDNNTGFSNCPTSWTCGP